MRLSVSTKLQGFAGPLDQLDVGLAEMVVIEYARAYAARFGDVHSAALDGSLRSFLSEWLARETTFEECWDVTHAELRRTVLQAGAVSPRRTAHLAANFGLRALSFGAPGGFESVLDNGINLRIGAWIIPRADRAAIEADGNEIRLTLWRNGRRSTYVIKRERRGSLLCDNLVPLPEFCVGSGRRPLLSPRACLAFSPNGIYSGPVHIAPDSCVFQMNRATELIKRKSPRYFEWVTYVLRAVIPCESVNSQLRSCSDFDLPGILQISFPTIPIAHAEMLVHEATHQYYQIVLRLGEVHDGSDKTLYYSPVKRTGRPIDRILLAYHAFANLVLFYRDCLQKGIRDAGYCERNERDTMPHVQQLESALRKTKALTPLGLSLWEPLSAAIWQ